MNIDRKDVNGKVDPFLLPWEAVEAFNAISDYGFKKYGNRDTWKYSKPEEGVRRYLAAMVRHAWKVVLGEYTDIESGLPHVYAVVWNACAACWHYARWTDLEKLEDLSPDLLKWPCTGCGAEEQEGHQIHCFYKDVY